MKLIQTLVVASAFFAASAYAVEPVRSEITCAELGDNYEVTAEAKERFSDLAGACEGVYEMNGGLYVRTQAVLRRKAGTRVYLYLPATDHTFSLIPKKDARVWVGNRKYGLHDLTAGDELGIYLSVDKLANERVDTVAFVTEDDHEEEIVEVAAETAPALPTTG